MASVAASVSNATKQEKTWSGGIASMNKQHRTKSPAMRRQQPEPIKTMTTTENSNATTKPTTQPHCAATYGSDASISNTIRKIRLKLALWLWPKDVRQGELFTITRHLRPDGTPTQDGSWVGKTLRADKVDGDRIGFSELNEWSTPPRYDRVASIWLVPGKNCLVKPISTPLTKGQERELYALAKAGRSIRTAELSHADET